MAGKTDTMTDSAFAPWSNFYVITGSSSAALIGLMFVVITLVAGRRTADSGSVSHEGSATFSTPTVVHFCAAFFISAILSAPWHSASHAAAIIALAGLCGVVYILGVTRRTARLTSYDPDVEDWVWFAILPLLAYGAVFVTGVLLFRSSPQALFALAGSVLLLVFIGIRNAWDVITYLAMDRSNSESDTPQ